MNYMLKDKIIGLACAAVAMYLLYCVGQGVLNGEITQLSKFSQKIIQRSGQPEQFWATLGFFSLGALILFKTAVKKFTSNYHR